MRNKMAFNKKTGVRWFFTAVAAFGLVGSTTPFLQNNFPMFTKSYVSANTETDKQGTIGTAHYQYEAASQTLTFDGAGTLPTGNETGTGVISSQISPNIQHIRFNAKVSLPERAGNMFSFLRELRDFSGMENLDTSNTTSMFSLFDTDTNLQSLDLSHFDTSKVTMMAYMFTGLNSIENLDLTSFDTSQVTNMVSMFSGDSSLEHLDLSTFNTEKVELLDGIFYSIAVRSDQLVLQMPHQRFSQEKSWLGFGANQFTQIQAVAGGTVQNPKGKNLSMDDFKALFDSGEKPADTYVFRKLLPAQQESKQVTRTIHYLDENGEEIKPETVQTVEFKRTVQKYLSGTVFSQGDWVPADSSKTKFAAVDVPDTIQNYETKQNHVPEADVPALTADTSSENVDYDVFYTAKKNDNNNDQNKGQNGNDNHQDKQSNSNSNGMNNGQEKTESAVKEVVNGMLPNTGKFISQHQLAALFSGMTAMLFAFFTTKKRK